MNLDEIFNTKLLPPTLVLHLGNRELIDDFVIWHPRRNDSEHGFSISDEGGWIPGAYIDRATAFFAATVFTQTAMGELQMKVNLREPNVQKRFITLQDLKKLYVEQPSSRLHNSHLSK